MLVKKKSSNQPSTPLQLKELTRSNNLTHRRYLRNWCMTWTLTKWSQERNSTKGSRREISKTSTTLAKKMKTKTTKGMMTKMRAHNEES
jgi:hypothetical protein